MHLSHRPAPHVSVVHELLGSCVFQRSETMYKWIWVKWPRKERTPCLSVCDHKKCAVPPERGACETQCVRRLVEIFCCMKMGNIYLLSNMNLMFHACPLPQHSPSPPPHPPFFYSSLFPSALFAHIIQVFMYVFTISFFLTAYTSDARFFSFPFPMLPNLSTIF